MLSAGGEHQQQFGVVGQRLVHCRVQQQLANGFSARASTWLPSDDDLNSYIRETDLSLYPYDSTYYKGVASGALNLAIANERPIVAYPVSTLKETNSDGHLVLTNADSYYELARDIQKIDLNAQGKKITQYAHDNSWKSLTARLVEAYRSII